MRGVLRSGSGVAIPALDPGRSACTPERHSFVRSEKLNPTYTFGGVGLTGPRSGDTNARIATSETMPACVYHMARKGEANEHSK